MRPPSLGREAFTPRSPKRESHDNDWIPGLTRGELLELTGQGGGEDPDAAVEILVDDVSTDIATARVVSPEYLDYLHLARTAEGWKIVNVLFHVRD